MKYLWWWQKWIKSIYEKNLTSTAIRKNIFWSKQAQRNTFSKEIKKDENSGLWT